MKWRIILTVFWIIFWGFLTEYVFMPAWSFSDSQGPYWNLFFFFGVLALTWWLGDDFEYHLVGKISSSITTLSFVVFVIVWFASCGACNAGKYQRLIGEIKETEFTANVQPIAANQMLIVDEEIARRIGEKELGSVPGLGSRCVLGDFTLQAVNGNLYWIAPLEHSGFWKWNGFSSEGTPGYVRVSAINQEDYALVRNTDSADIHIKYQTGSFFNQDLNRHIYTSGYRTKLFSNYEFEVDDQWRPYWTITLYEAKVGFNGADAVGVLTVNPETGEIKEYSIEQAPKWIDRIQVNEHVQEQIDDWGQYIHGWPNWSNRDVKRVVQESSLVLGADGVSYYYYGLKSSGNENSTIGFVMVNTRTKKAHWFKQAGATENAAKGSAEGKVQEKGYVSSEGVTYNIDGRPTYEFLLKDKAGLMKLIALVNVYDHNIVGTGENRHDAIQDYRSQLSGRGNAVSIATSDMEYASLTSKVERFAVQVVKGNTTYYLTLTKKPSTIFMVSPTVSIETALTKEGDVVSIKYIPPRTPQEISLIDFDNLSIGSSKDSVQTTNEMKVDSVRNQRVNVKAGEVMDVQWDSLSLEQKKKLLKKSKL